MVFESLGATVWGDVVISCYHVNMGFVAKEVFFHLFYFVMLSGCSLYTSDVLEYVLICACIYIYI